jgi:phage N-6-adenine-methyltransferase
MIKVGPVRLPMPVQKPHGSKQDIETPPDLIAAVEGRFGPLAFDLASDGFNAKADRYYTPHHNSLAQPWHRLAGWLWLNPPYGREIGIWAKKCADEMQLGATILFLTPASVGAEWYRWYVRPFAHSLFLWPRIKFVGEPAGYPKDCMLSVFAYGLTGDSIWQWRALKNDRRHQLPQLPYAGPM